MLVCTSMTGAVVTLAQARVQNAYCLKGDKMRQELRDKIIAVCQKKMAQKGPDVGLSFYAFFANKNDDPTLLMEAATWWIQKHQLDHFEKASKVMEMVRQGL